ncbi:MAG: type VI secretion system tube protein Hcp [Acidobacteriota bacterium]
MPIYLRMDGVNGGVMREGHVEWIELESCQLGVQRTVTSSSGRGTNREMKVPSVSEIVATKSQDNASTALSRQALAGAGKKVTIDFVNSDGTTYLSLELEGVLISSFNVGGHRGVRSDRPMESFSLNFTKITSTAKPVAPPSGEKHTMFNTDWRATVACLA